MGGNYELYLDLKSDSQILLKDISIKSTNKLDGIITVT
jgi:hypothetical protein